MVMARIHLRLNISKTVQPAAVGQMPHSTEHRLFYGKLKLKVDKSHGENRFWQKIELTPFLYYFLWLK